MNQEGKSFKDYFKGVAAALNKPMNIGEILSTPIHIPGLTRSRKPKRRVAAKPKTAEQPAQNARSFLLEGTLQPGTNTKFSICDTDFEIDSNTWIVGSIEIGAHVKVKGQTVWDKKLATQLVVLRQP